MEENGLCNPTEQGKPNDTEARLSLPKPKRSGSPKLFLPEPKHGKSPKSSKIDIAVKILRGALIVLAAAAYTVYIAKNIKILNVSAVLITFLCIALFTSIGLYAMPVIVRDLIGRQKAYYPKTAETKRRFWYICLAALVFYIVFTLIGTLMYKCVHPEFQGDFFSLTQRAWMKENTDAQHYFDIAEHGYVNEGDEKLFIVFFPMFPYLIRLLNFITKSSWLSSQFINITASVFGAGLYYLTYQKLFGCSGRLNKRGKTGIFDDGAFFAALIALLLPGMIFICSPMTEPLFLVFTAGCFYFISCRKFLPAACFAALAGFTRSVGILLIVPLIFEAISDTARACRNKKTIKTKLIILFVSAFIACIGTLAYLLINLRVTGNALKFTEYQKSNWHQSIGFFGDTPRYLLSNLIRNFKTGRRATAFALELPQLIMIFGSLLIYLSAARRLPASYTLYFLAYFIITVGCTWLLSAVRYFSLLLPLPAAIAALCKGKISKITVVLVLFGLSLVYMFMYMERLHIY